MAVARHRDHGRPGGGRAPPGERLFQVIETCSGLRSIFVLTTLAVGWLCFFPTRRLPAALLILSAPVIAYFVNTLRVLSLVLNPGSDLASIHSLQGVGIFLLGLLILYGVDSLLRRIPGGNEAQIGEPETALPPRRLGSARAVRSRWPCCWPPCSGCPSGARGGIRRTRLTARVSTCPREIDGWKVARKLEAGPLLPGERGIPEPLVR